MSILVLGPVPGLRPNPSPIPIPDPAPNLVDMMIIQDQGLLEVEAIVEAIEKTAMMTVDMIEVKDVGIVRKNVSVSIIRWYVLDVTYIF